MILEVAGPELQTEIMDHHGIVAGSCRELDIANRINQRIGSNDPRRVIQPGLAVVAMIINGLGFTGRRLYLTPQFFQDKAIGQFFEADVESKALDDHALGKALDEIADYGSSKLFAELAFDIGTEHQLLGKQAHLDTTSFSLTGDYNTQESTAIEVRHGYSKDHRPDLKQVMLSMTVTGESNIPIWMEPLNGNSSDKENFHTTIKSVREFQKQLKESKDFMWIADAALYTSSKLLKYNDFTWLSRVPENIKMGQDLLQTESDDLVWHDAGDGYSYSKHKSNYGGINQRWLLVYSEQGYKREAKTLEKRILKQEAEAKTLCWHSGNQVFNCEKDALGELRKIQKKYTFLTITGSIEPIEKYEGRGRPKKMPKEKWPGLNLCCQWKEINRLSASF